MVLKAQGWNELLYCETYSEGTRVRSFSEVEVGFIFPISRKKKQQKNKKTKLNLLSAFWLQKKNGHGKKIPD